MTFPLPTSVDGRPHLQCADYPGVQSQRTHLSILYSILQAVVQLIRLRHAEPLDRAVRVDHVHFKKS